MFQTFPKPIEKLIENLENSRINILAAFILFSVITSFRIYSEFYLWIRSNEFFIIPAFYEEYVHQFSFYSTMFLGGIFIISYLSKTHFVKVIKVVLHGWWILTLPPIIDYVIVGRTEGYRYGLPEDFLTNTVTLGLYANYIGIGQFIMGSIICSLTAIYIYYRSKSILKAIGGIVSIYFMMLIIGSPELYLPFSVEYKSFLFIWYLMLSIIFAILIIYKDTDKKNIYGFIKHLKPIRTLHFVSMTLIGLVVAGEIEFVEIVDYPYIITSILMIILIWQYTSLINDIYDKNIDQISNKQRPLTVGLMNETQYFHIAIVVAIIAVGTGVLLGKTPLILTIIGLILGTIYSVPPIRLKNHIFSSSVIGAGSSIAFLIGYYTPDFGHNIVDLTPKAILITLLIFIVLSLAPLTTDLKDYEGDKKNKVKTLYTVYGKEKGKKVTSVLLFVTFLIPIILFNKIIDFVLFLGLAFFATIIFLKKESLQGIMISYIVTLTYCIIRI